MMKWSLSLLLCCLASAAAWGADLRPTPRPDDLRLRLVENTWSCHAGYGLQQDALQLAGTKLGTDQGPNPLHALSKPGAIGFGCIAPWFYTTYSLLDRSLPLPQGTVVEGQSFNQVSYRLDQFALGTSWPLIAHRLYADLGLQPYILSYSFGLFPLEADQVVRSKVFKQNGTLVQTRLRLYWDAFFFGFYELSQNPDGQGEVRTSAKVGLNMTVRY